MTLTELAKKLPAGAITAEATDEGFRVTFDKTLVTVHHFNNETGAGVDVAIIPKEA